MCELQEDIIKAVEEARIRVKRGDFLTEEEARVRLGL